MIFRKYFTRFQKPSFFRRTSIRSTGFSCKTALFYAIAFILSLQATFTFARSEQEIKAAYLYNFIKFINWPKPLNNPAINLCILGDDPLNENLKHLDQRPIHGTPIHTIHLKRLPLLSSCHIVFIGRSETQFVDEIFTTLGQDPVLTVSTIDKFASLGGTIGFITLGNVVRFNINLKHAQYANLTISSKLLELANDVVK